MGREMLAGMSMSLALVPALAVVPALQAQAGMDPDGSYAACVLASLLATLWLGRMGVPLAASGNMAVAVWLAHIVVLAHGHSWQSALGAALLASLLCLLLLCTPLGSHFHQAVPEHLRRSLPGGLGLMLIFAGLAQGHILADAPVGLVMLGNFEDPVAFDALLGILLTAILTVWGVPCSILLGMLAVALISLFQGFWAMPEELFQLPRGLEATAIQADILGGLEMPDVILTLALLQAVAVEGTRMAFGRPEGKGIAAAAFGMSAAGACLGSFPLAPAAESSAGLGSGGRTGCAALAAAAVLMLFLFCFPMVSAMASFGAIAAPALAMAGYWMLGRTEWGWRDDPAKALSAGAMLVLMPMAQSIFTGLGAGILLYVLLAAARGAPGEVPRAAWILAVLFLLFMLF